MYKKPRKFDGFDLIKELGQGGNGVVWEAVKGKRTVAIKILKTKNINSYLYKRFTAEIEFLKENNKRKGILNIIEAHIPKNYREKAWYTMPVAKSLKSYLEENEQSIENKIELFVSISDTLVELHAQGIYHRDIKPENLFWYNEEAVISDFGLVSFPGKKTLTENEKKIGSIFYIAPEMKDPKNASFAKADVYSLAKTLWVILSSQNYPFLGEHSLSFKPILLKSLVKCANISYLDTLINRATLIDPQRRIGMEDFNEELKEWLNLKKAKTSNPIDLDLLMKELDMELSPELDKKMLKEDLSRRGDMILQDLISRFEITISEMLKEPGLKNFLKLRNNNQVIIEANSIVNYDGYREIIKRNGYTYVLDLRKQRITFWIGTGYEIFENGTINIALGSQLRDKILILDGVWSSNEVSMIDSAQFENSVTRLFETFEKELPNTIKILLETIKSRGSDLEIE